MPFANVNGLKLHYEVAGSGHPIVLVHGHALDSRMWREQVPALSRLYTVVTCDLRGHGKSEAPESGYSRAHYAEDLHRLIACLGLSKPSVVGHSMGGGVALEYALRHPQRLATLTLVSSGLEGLGPSPSMAQVVAKQKEVVRREGVSAKFLRAALISPLFDGVRKDREKLALVRRMLSEWSGASWRDPTVYPTPPTPHAKRLGELRVPVLVVTGEREPPGFHEAAEALAKGITVVRTAQAPGAGHLSPLETPDAFNDTLLDFVGGAAGKALL